MSEPRSAADHRTPVHWTALAYYRLRTGAFGVMFAAVALHGWDRAYSPTLWALITLHLLVYPHLVFWRARRSANSLQAEVQNLAIDSMLFGLLMATLGFPLWIAFTVYIASTLNLTINRGARGLLISQLSFFGGALLSITLLGWRFSPETEWPVTLLCVAGNTVYMISIALTAFGRYLQLRKTGEALRQGELALTQRIAEIQALQAKLQDQATRDPLTGLYNRRFLDTIAAREIARCRRESQHLTVMMIDIDHFKDVNDTYGHPGGDEVLKGLAAMLRENVRSVDVPCRFGGEEFLLLLPGMPPDIARIRAEQWRAAFADMSVTVDGSLVKATLSIGVAVYPAHGETLDELVLCADQALYRAKAAGRNRAVLYDRGWSTSES